LSQLFWWLPLVVEVEILFQVVAVPIPKSPVTLLTSLDFITLFNIANIA
jgi:hypothetical protein